MNIYTHDVIHSYSWGDVTVVHHSTTGVERVRIYTTNMRARFLNINTHTHKAVISPLMPTDKNQKTIITWPNIFSEQYDDI